MDHNDELNQTLSQTETVSEEGTLTSLISNWSAMNTSERKEHFSGLSRVDAEELFLSLSAHDQAELLMEANPPERRSWVRLLAPDDVADLIQEMDPEEKDPMLSLLDPQTKREVSALLAYAEDNAGGLMSSRFVRLRPEMTVDEAISYLRIQSKTNVETIYYCYVLAQDQTLLGVVSFRELFSAATGKRVQDIMHTDIVKVPVELDQEQIAPIFQQQSLLALPVVDSENHMKGIVTLDDIAETIQEEATEDIHKMGGTETLDAPYMKTSILELMRKRVGWLAVLFIGQMFTATAMKFFELEIERAIVLALFIPLIISAGGNSGSQASTLIIRALSLGEVRLRDWWRVFQRELISGLLLGVILGVLGFLRITVWPDRSDYFGPHWFSLALTVAFSVVGVVIWGTLIGSMLPFLLKRLKLDPASASAPMVATLVDVTGIVIYFSVATLLLTGKLL